MQNNFTYENTKDATHVHFIKGSGGGVQFGKGKMGADVWMYANSGSMFEWVLAYGGYDDNAKNYHIDLTDQTGRGYPTLEWFLGRGCKLEVSDSIIGRNGHVYTMNTHDDVRTYNGCKDEDDVNRYVKSLHDNRHDLTAMARNEYYSKKAERDIELGKSFDFKVSPESRPNLTRTPEETEAIDAIEKKQWPNNERIDAIGQNGNNGEHYPHESESPLSPNFESKPVYTQEMHDRGELPPVGSECLAMFSLNDMPDYWLKVRVLMFNEINAAACYLVDNELLDGKNLLWSCNFKPIDNRTDEERLRDELIDCIEFDDDDASERSIKSLAVASILDSDKFTITLNEWGKNE